MIPVEYRLKFILTELFNKLCSCIRDDKEKENLLNPYFHSEDCLYKITVEKETNIEWTKEQTQDS